jgi:hypothetical protein
VEVVAGAVDCAGAAGAGGEAVVEPDEEEPLLLVPLPFFAPELPESVVFEPLLDGPNGSEYWSSPAPP